MPTDYRHTDNHLKLVMVVVAHSAVRVLTDGQTDRQTDGRTLPILLFPCFAKATRSIKIDTEFTGQVTRISTMKEKPVLM